MVPEGQPNVSQGLWMPDWGLKGQPKNLEYQWWVIVPANRFDGPGNGLGGKANGDERPVWGRCSERRKFKIFLNLILNEFRFGSEAFFAREKQAEAWFLFKAASAFGSAFGSLRKSIETDFWLTLLTPFPSSSIFPLTSRWKSIETDFWLTLLTLSPPPAPSLRWAD